MLFITVRCIYWEPMGIIPTSATNAYRSAIVIECFRVRMAEYTLGIKNIFMAMVSCAFETEL